LPEIYANDHIRHFAAFSALRRRNLDDKKRREIAESVISGRKSGAEMARLYDVSEPTVSRIVAEFRQREAHKAFA
jgi:hypothetical protein